MKCTYILRVWMPDRPGALGALASRIGAVGGDVVGIDILERGAGRAVDELVVELPGGDASLVELLMSEIHQVDGVDVEDIRPAADALHDPRLDALETAAVLVGAPTPDSAIAELCAHAVRTVGASWGAVVDLDAGEVIVSEGEIPSTAWIVAFVAGSQSSARVADGDSGPADVAWAPLPSAGLALVLGRNGQAFRARERRQAAALARIVDTRFRELRAFASRLLHPSTSH
ncbi:MAG TPA: hypothetical protein VIY72_10205 [Acidimicrobiales bacterium]